MIFNWNVLNTCTSYPYCFVDFPINADQHCLTYFTRSQYIGEQVAITGDTILGDVIIVGFEVEPNQYRFACGVSAFMYQENSFNMVLDVTSNTCMTEFLQ